MKNPSYSFQKQTPINKNLKKKYFVKYVQFNNNVRDEKIVRDGKIDILIKYFSIKITIIRLVLFESVMPLAPI